MINININNILCGFLRCLDRQNNAYVFGKETDREAYIRKGSKIKILFNIMCTQKKLGCLCAYVHNYSGYNTNA